MGAGYRLGGRTAAFQILALVEEADSEKGSSPASRGGAGVYIEGELGAFYLLTLLAGTERVGFPEPSWPGSGFRTSIKGMRWTT